MAVIDSLNAAYANVAANLAAITANPKPTYTIDGADYNWQELFDSYTQRLLDIEKAIQRASGPFLISTRVVS